MISALYLKNWGPYRGEHELRLSARAYGVFARDEKDDERSNWSGKSMLLEAIDFALWGRLNPDRHFGKNDWISEGEDEGYVRLVLGDRAVTRFRIRDKAEKLTFAAPSQVEAKPDIEVGDVAQASIARLVGLSKDDFLTAAYFRQRQMAQLVLMRPGPRMDVVSGWIGLAPLEKAEADRRARFREATEEAAKITAKAVALEASIDEFLMRVGIATEANVDLEFHKLEEGIKRDEAELKACVAECELAHKDQGLRAHSAEFLNLQAKGKALAAEVTLVDVENLRAALERSRAAEKVLLLKIGPLRALLQERRLVARGQFGGMCPVVDHKCPSADWVDAQKEEVRGLVARGDVDLERMSTEYGLHVQGTKRLEREVQDHENRLTKLGVMRARARALKESHDLAQREGVVDADAVNRLFAELGEKQAGVAALREKRRVMGEAIEAARAKATEAQELRVKATEVLRVARARRESATIFASARRRVGESSLAEIEAGANEVLQECGVDLRVAASWSREGGDPAKQCPECGAAMPASAKVKTCATCGAERGLSIVNELRIRLSSHSGAAEDLAGMALQLSAGDWLRTRRESAWGCGLIDEPFSACDKRHRKLMATHLAKVIMGGKGFRQAIVCAHESQILESLPGRIEIVRRGKWSEIKVVS